MIEFQETYKRFCVYFGTFAIFLLPPVYAIPEVYWKTYFWFALTLNCLIYYFVCIYKPKQDTPKEKSPN